MANTDGDQGGPGELRWNVVMLGPSRVGKTSLLTALRVAGQAYFEGTQISVEPENDHTRRAFNDNDTMMRGELSAHRFSPDSLPGDEEEHRYGLAINAGVDQYRLIMQFRDYPGAWLHDDHAQRVKEMLEDAAAVIVPIDSTLLMETGREHSHALAGLALVPVEENIREWAKRRRSEGDVALLILAPVKCESYFKDNGGRRNKSEALFERVQDHYSSVVKAFVKEGPAKAEVLYAPVDTIGPIELMDVQWEKDGRVLRMVPTYRVRVDPQGRARKRTVKGAEPVLAYLIRDVLRTLDEMLRLDHERVERKGGRARSNWWKRFWDTALGHKDARESERRRLNAERTTTNETLRRLAEPATTASPHAEYTRVRPWN